MPDPGRLAAGLSRCRSVPTWCPALMGGGRVVVLPIHIYQQVAEVGNWQMGAALACVLFALSLTAVALYQHLARRATEAGHEPSPRAGGAKARYPS